VYSGGEQSVVSDTICMYVYTSSVGQYIVVSVLCRISVPLKCDFSVCLCMVEQIYKSF